MRTNEISYFERLKKKTEQIVLFMNDERTNCVVYER